MINCVDQTRSTTKYPCVGEGVKWVKGGGKYLISKNGGKIRYLRKREKRSGPKRSKELKGGEVARTRDNLKLATTQRERKTRDQRRRDGLEELYQK